MNSETEESQAFPKQGETPQEADKLRRDVETLRDRLSRLSEAGLRISESLDLDTVLHEVVDSARALTGARYSGITTLDDAGQLQEFITSGFTPEEHQRFLDMPEGPELFEYFSQLPHPLRLRDLIGYTSSLGFSGNLPPVNTFLGTPMRHRGAHVGNFYLAAKEGGREFTDADEEILVMFASQAATAIVNARKHRDEQQARADLEALIDTSPVGVLVFDARTGALLSLNEEARRLAGGGRGRAVEQLLEVLTFRRADGREFPLDEASLTRLLRSGATVRAEEIVIHFPDGKSVTTLVNATPIWSKQGEVASVVATVQDLTPLEELERLRAEFLGMVSHELRTPLTTIKGASATVLGATSPLDSAETRLFFRIIDEQADYMRDLINDLLDVTRIEAGRLVVTPELADVVEVVEQARNAFLRAGTGHSIQLDLAADLPWVMADRRRIIQVLNNLFSNACKHSPESSTIRVTAVQEALHVAVSVVDEGRGVSTERLPHLFKKFFRINGKDAQRDIEGTGLGLAICKGIVEAHGGRIWAESDGPGLGARFTFTLPAVNGVGNDAATGPVRISADAGRTTRARILVVDDNPRILRYVRNTLAQAGYIPIVSATAEEVDNLIEMNKPHLVLLDLLLPGSDGFELMRRITEMTDAPVIFLSGCGEDQTIARALELGAADYIVKPFSPIELVARIESTLRKRVASDRLEALKPYLLEDLTINYAERSVTVAGRPVKLTATEYKLLCELSVNAGRVLTHDQLLQRVWGRNYSDDPRLIRTAVKSLRHKLGDDARSPSYIFTEPRVGYRMAKAEKPGQATP